MTDEERAELEDLRSFKASVVGAEAHFAKEISLLRDQERSARESLAGEIEHPKTYDMGGDTPRLVDWADVGFYQRLPWAVMRLRRAIQERKYDGKIIIPTGDEGDQ